MLNVVVRSPEFASATTEKGKDSCTSNVADTLGVVASSMASIVPNNNNSWSAWAPGSADASPPARASPHTVSTTSSHVIHFVPHLNRTIVWPPKPYPAHRRPYQPGT